MKKLIVSGIVLATVVTVLTPLPQAVADEGEARAVNLRMPRFAKPAKGPAYLKSSTAWSSHGSGPIDFNKDGRAEIVQTYSNYPGLGPDEPEPIVILGYHKKSGTYRKRTSVFLDGTVPEQVHSRVFEVADLNGDGRSDYFLGGHGYDQMPFAGEKDWLLMSRPGKKHRAVVAPPGLDTYTHASASGDIDGDGKKDLFAGPMNLAPYFLMGKSGTGLTVNNDSLNDFEESNAESNTAAVLADINGDRRPDLILGKDGGGENVAYFNDGTGKFLSPTPDLTLPEALFGANTTITVDAVSFDANTDGKPDILFSQTGDDPTYTGYGLQLLINTGGNFVDESDRVENGSGFRPTGSWRAKILLADFYGDGIQDFITQRFCGEADEGYLIWINDGSGQFAPRPWSLVGTSDPDGNCNMIHPVDFNRDKRTDLVEIVRLSDTKEAAWLYRNRGPGTSGTPTRAEVARQPQDDIVAIGERFSISASVLGTRPLRFQWFKDGVAISGARKPVLTIASATTNAAGTYKLRIRNAAGDRFTNEVTISVVP